MSIRLMSMVFETSLDTRDKFILLAMADYASDSGDSIFPSAATLARKTSMNEKSVWNAIKSLQALGFLIVQSGGGRHITNNYKIVVSKLKEGNYAPDSQYRGENYVNGSRNYVNGSENYAPDAPDPSLNTKETSVSTPNFRLMTPKQCYDVPEIKDYCQITGRDPGIEQCYVIHEMLHNKTYKFDALQRAWREWVKRGYNTRNLAWIEWGLMDAIPDREGNYPKAGNPENEKRIQEMLDAAAKRQEEEKQKNIEEARRLYGNLPPKFEETMAKLAKEKSI